MYNINREQIVDANLEEVFGFFEKPENLQIITPDWMKFDIITPHPLEMKEHAEFDYKISLMFIPLKWKTEITNYDPPYKFVDEQKKGPYKLWIHTHTFEAVGNKTKITDNVDYDLFGGPFKILVHSLYIRKNLESIFNYRSRKINQLFNKKGVHNVTQ